MRICPWIPPFSKVFQELNEKFGKTNEILEIYWLKIKRNIKVFAKDRNKK